MLKIENLVTLVRSLTINEKHHFNRYTALTMKCRKLYAVLSRHTADSSQESDKELWLTEALRATQTKGALATAQNLLGRALLRSLRMQKADIDSPKLAKEDVIKALIQDATILLQRGIFDAAIDKCQEAVKLGTAFDYPALVSEALRSLIYLSGQQDLKQYDLRMDTLLHQLEQFTRLQKEESDYFTLQYRTLLLFRQARSAYSPGVEAEISKLRTDPLLQALPVAATFLSKVYFQMARATLYAVSGDRHQAKACHFAILQLWEDQQYAAFKLERPRLFIIHLANYLTYCNTLRSFENFQQYYEQLEQVMTYNFDDEAEAFQNRILIKQQHYLNRDELEKAVELITEIEAGFIKYQVKINKSRELTLRYNHIIALFALERYQDALSYTQILVDFTKTKHRQDIQFFLKVFLVVIHFELNGHQHLDNVIRSTRLLFKSKNELLEYDRIILRNLAKIVNLKLYEPGNKKTVNLIRHAFDRFRNELLVFAADKQVRPIGFYEILLWVKKGASPVPVTFRDMLREEIAASK